MPRIKLTAAAVERLRAPKTGQIDYFDAGYPALCLRITEHGVKSWTYFGRVNGRLKRATLGRYPDLSLAEARRKAGEVADAMRKGEDPTAAKRAARKAAGEAPRDSVASVATEWLKRDQADNRGQGEVKRLLDRDVLPDWGARKIQAITRRDAIELIDRIADRGAATMARRMHAHLHRLFRWSAARGIVETNPFADLPKPGREVRRDRVLSDAELGELWQASGTLGWPFGPALRLLTLTAGRREEIGACTWPEVDEKDAVIRLAAARTKAGEPRTIPLSAPALAVLKELPRLAPAKGAPSYVFTTNGKTPVSGWSRAKENLDVTILEERRAAAVESMNDAEEAKALPAWRIHDLRRTVATGLQRLGFRLEVIEAVLGHVSGSRAGIVGVYQRHAFENEKRAALDAWGRHVEALTVGQRASANVVALRVSR